MGWKDALLGANARQPGPVFAAYEHLQDVALNARSQTVESYRLLKIHASHPWLTDSQTQAYFHSAWMLDAFVKAAQASIDEVAIKRTISDEAVALAQVFYDEASAWAGYRLVVPNSDRGAIRSQQPKDFQLAPAQLASFEAVRMAIAAAEALHSCAVDCIVDISGQENLPREWQRHLSLLQDRVLQAGSDLSLLSPVKQSLQRGGVLPPHLAPAVIRVVDALLALGRHLNQPATLNPALTAKNPVNILDLGNQPVAAPGKTRARYASLDHAALASTATSLGFDVWRLVAPEQRQQRSSDRKDVRALDRLMAQADPRIDGPTIRRILDEIDEAQVARTGTITRSPREALLSVPWSPVFMATGTVTLGGERFGQGEKFAYTVKTTGGRFVHTFERLGFDPAHTPAKPVRRPAQREAEPARTAPNTPRPAPALPAPDPLWRYSAPKAWHRWGKDDARGRVLTDFINTVRKSAQWGQLQTYQAEIEAARSEGKIEHHQEYQERACPWAPVYVALEPITLCGKDWRAGDAFYLLISSSKGQVTVTGQPDGHRRL